MNKYSEEAKKVYDFIGTLSKESPKIAKGFMAMNEASAVDGAISAKYKELIALSISIAIRCEGCIACHVKGALGAGASKDEIMEVIGVAISMGGGPALVFGNKTLEAMNEMMKK